MSQQYNYKEIIEGQIPDLYKSNSFETNTVGNTLNKIQNDVDKLEKEVNPITMASAGLEKWEGFFKLPSNVQEDVNGRRAKAIAELIQFVSDENVIRKDEMESIMSLFADDCEVLERFEDSAFDVVFKFNSNNSSLINISDIQSLMKKIKPSWLAYTLNIEFEEGIKVKDEFDYHTLLSPICGTFKLGATALKKGYKTVFQEVDNEVIQVGDSIELINVYAPLVGSFRVGNTAMRKG